MPPRVTPETTSLAPNILRRPWGLVIETDDEAANTRALHTWIGGRPGTANDADSYIVEFSIQQNHVPQYHLAVRPGTQQWSLRVYPVRRHDGLDVPRFSHNTNTLDELLNWIRCEYAYRTFVRAKSRTAL